MDSIQLLDWDTQFFGFPIARVVNPRASAEELRQAVAELRRRRIPLAYWAADRPSVELQALADSLGGRLVDEKLTFLVKLASLPEIALPATPRVESYQENMSLADLKQLAVESGIYSRFIVDPRFPKDKARAMFEEWMVRSVQKIVAEEVLVIRDGERVVGMATLAVKGDRGSIGLVAVHESARGKRYGEALVRAAQAWCASRGLAQCQVTTQAANLPARKLYEKCGFRLDQTEFYFHIWT